MGGLLKQAVKKAAKANVVFKAGKWNSKMGKWNSKRRKLWEASLPKLKPSFFVKQLRVANDMSECERVYTLAKEADQDKDTYLGNELVLAFAKCGTPEEAKNVFDGITKPNAHSWTILLKAYVWKGRYRDALNIFHEMLKNHVEPDSVTLVAALMCCSTLGDIAEGTVIAKLASSLGFTADMHVQNSLLNMYCKCSRVDKAARLFSNMDKKDAISYSTLIAAYAQRGYRQKVMYMFHMMDLEGISPDAFVLGSVLIVCSTLKEGREIHSRISLSGYGSFLVVQNNLLRMYDRLGSLDDAIMVLKKMDTKDVISWNAIIAAYVQHNQPRKALSAYVEMGANGVKPNLITYTRVLLACSMTGALEQGKDIHSCITKIGRERDAVSGVALVNLYAKCGRVEEARHSFRTSRRKIISLWTGMAAAYAQQEHMHINRRLELFYRMNHGGIQTPGTSYFTSILSACSSGGGLPEEGQKYFFSMIQDYNVTPTRGNYMCMIDLLGRAGKLGEAEELISNMPFEPGLYEWICFLSGCKFHGRFDRAVAIAKEHLIEMDFDNDDEDVVEALKLLLEIYAKAGKLDNDSAQLGKMLEEKPGCTYIEVQKKLHEFICRDKSHLLFDEIQKHLEELKHKMLETGYVYQSDDHDKTGYHGEKMAVALGLMLTSPQDSLFIVKNRRICSHCHSDIQLISKIVGRKITIRDSKRFHTFIDGSCSCCGYW